MRGAIAAVMVAQRISAGGGTPFSLVLGNNTGNDISGVEFLGIRAGGEAGDNLSAEDFVHANSDTRAILGHYPALASVASTLGGAPTFGTGTGIRLYKNNTGNDPIDIGVQRLKLDFTLAQASWNNRATATAWATAGALGTADIEATLSVTLTVTTTGGYYLITGTQIIADIQGIHDATSGYAGHRLAAITTFVQATFANHLGTDGNRPELVLEGTYA